MNDMTKYVEAFFGELEVFEDKCRGHCYKIYIEQAILAFLRNETKETAFAVYRAFFDSYRIALQGASNPFIDLIDALKNYEENAAVLIDKQRDHYIHSVNVFILGLCVYGQNAGYRAAFDKTVMDKREYPDSYDTKHEEFFYRWGLAALFHDVGYPVEIVGRQINKFMDFAADADGKNGGVGARLSFANFDELNRIAEVTPRRAFTKCYSDRHADSARIDPLKPVDLLAHKIHTSLGVDLGAVKSALDGFVDVMAGLGFIDHGYYSAIIVLKWYGFLIQSAGYKPEYFFGPVLDSASAIVLHNGYKSIMQREPFSLGALSPETHPTAFLLMLCDELQDWNREAYGLLDKLQTLAAEARLDISDEALRVTFVAHNGSLLANFSRDKKKLLRKLLDLNALFGEVSIRCRAVKKPALPEPDRALAPRPMLSDLEQLARAIHECYNQKQLERYPDRPLEYPDFDALPDSLKYSNLRQAMDIPEKLRRMGLVMGPADPLRERVTEIPAEFVEVLAEQEHEAWIAERLSGGWTAGPTADAEKKQSLYLVPYRKLPEEIKQRDRDPVQSIPAMLSRIGMAIYRKG